jgi:flagellar biogenesis protein FliO
MELEKRITKIERVSVRVFGLLMLIIAFLAVLTYVVMELCKFISERWMSW